MCPFSFPRKKIHFYRNFVQLNQKRGSAGGKNNRILTKTLSLSSSAAFGTSLKAALFPRFPSLLPRPGD